MWLAVKAFVFCVLHLNFLCAIRVLRKNPGKQHACDSHYFVGFSDCWTFYDYIERGCVTQLLEFLFCVYLKFS
jgi:hypothetical protein